MSDRIAAALDRARQSIAHGEAITRAAIVDEQIEREAMDSLEAMIAERVLEEQRSRDLRVVEEAQR